MICPQCQSDNPANAAFCDECGARLEMACPNCGEPNRRSAKFCRNCGQSINQAVTTASLATAGAPAPDTYVPKHLAEKILATRHTLEGERKQVTVLFADIRDSMKLIENRDPEEAQKIFDPVLKIMMDAVHRYEGTVNQVLGDGIMALFGAPLAHEDHALRACYAALAMQDEMRQHRQRLGQSEESGLHIGVGMNSGEVVVRSIDNDLNIDYSALGQTTHLAARMQELAGPGVSLLSSNTLRQVEGFIQVKSLGAVPVKGVSRPVDSYEIIGATSARTRVQAGAARGLTPLVGRSMEIDIFNKLVDRAKGGHGQILAMVGEPGMGKSRLVHEFTRHQLPPDWRVLEATSVSYGKATPYFPLIEMLCRYFQITAGESSENIRDQVVMHILQLDNSLKDAIPPIVSLLGGLPDEKNSAGYRERDWLAQLPDIGEMIRRFNSMDSQQRRRYTLDAIKRICVRESRRQNLLLIFEDLHWIDHETQAFLDALVESLPMNRLMLLVNYRPEYKHNWSDKSYYTQVRVDPLQTSSAEELLSKLLGTNRNLAALKELLIRRTEGNPFFAEETVRSLAEIAVLTGEKGAYRPGLKIDDLVIPSTVQSVVADRIDRLPIEEKHLLQTAAVIGVIVPFDLLHAVSELSDDQLFHYLAHLQSAEFIHETNLFPNLEYTFKHALTHEVAYGALLHERRTVLHAQIVRAIEVINAGNLQEKIEQLAQHAQQGALWEKAVFYLWQSGAKASSRSANQEAREFYGRALQSLEHLPQTGVALQQAIDLRLDLRNPLFLLGEFERLYSCLRDAERIAENLDDQRRLGRVLNFLISYYGLIGEHDRAIDACERALSLNSVDTELNTVTYYYLGQANFYRGQYGRAMEALNHSLSLIRDEKYKYERFGTAYILSVINEVWLVQCLAVLGAFEEGAVHAQRGIEIAQAANHVSSLAYAYCSLGLLALLKGDVNEAIVALEKARKMCEDSDIKVLLTHIWAHLGLAYALSGRVSEALPLLEMSDKQSALMGRKAGQSLRTCWHAQARFLSGEISTANDLVTRAFELAVQAKEPGHQGWALRLLGDIAVSENAESSIPEQYYAQAIALANDLEMKPLAAHCRLGLGTLWLQQGDEQRAEFELSAANRLYRQIGMTFWLNQTEAKLRQLSAYNRTGFVGELHDTEE
jgi:class 3 adenylate cyclase/tetratricopeptide (TPR) repeat protein